MKQASSILKIESDLAHAWSLPAEFYFDSGTLIQEKERIFARTWQLVGGHDQLAKPGDYFTARIADEPLLLARDEARKLRGFYNVCRHRAGPPAEGCGSRKVFRCGYHGWTYGLDGGLISTPEFEGVADFRPQEFGLRPVRTEEWAGLVFVNLDDKAGPLSQSFGDFPQQVARYQQPGLKLRERREYVVECNWKAYIDNYLEGYHVPSVHPSLNREVDYNQYVVEAYSHYCKHSTPIRTDGNGARSYRASAGSEEAAYFWIFPNWMLNFYPGNLQLNMVRPLEAERTLVIFEWYVPPDKLESPEVAEGIKLGDQTQQEDGAICEVVQRNLHSRSYQRGRYSVKQEKCVHAFHRMYAEWMAKS